MPRALRHAAARIVENEDITTPSTLVWPDGADLRPDVLYAEATGKDIQDLGNELTRHGLSTHNRRTYAMHRSGGGQRFLKPKSTPATR